MSDDSDRGRVSELVARPVVRRTCDHCRLRTPCQLPFLIPGRDDRSNAVTTYETTINLFGAVGCYVTITISNTDNLHVIISSIALILVNKFVIGIFVFIYLITASIG